MNIMLLAPELVVLLGSLILFVISLGESKSGQARAATVVIAVLAVLAGMYGFWLQGDLFYAAYRIDLFSQLFKLLIVIGLALVVLFGQDLKGIDHAIRPEYYLFLLISTLGLMMLVSSVELLTLFISLELSSYSLYLLVPLRQESKGIRMQMESAVKYVMFGIIAVGVMLFGMSYIFGLTGSTYLNVIVPRMNELGAQPVAMVAIAMFMGGLFFKLAVFPFHFWVPDVYQGASNETTAFIASVPKLGAVAILIRITTMISAEGQILVNLMIILAIASMFYGNLAALVQKDIKRMLGFSGIAHAGFVMLGLITLKETGFVNSIYYISGYIMMNLACFLVICKVSSQGENVSIEELTGLYKRSPLLALTLLIGMFALAGIPPLVGFVGKFMLLAGVLQEWSLSIGGSKNWYLTLVILAALNTAIAIYYYLSVVRISFCTDTGDRPVIRLDGVTMAVSVLLIIAIIAMGVAPSRILDFAAIAVRSIL